MVPYLGGAPQALNDVVSGRVPMVIDAYPPLLGALAGAIRALAVSSTKRLSELPDLPTVAETLPASVPEAGSLWSPRSARPTRLCAS